MKYKGHYNFEFPILIKNDPKSAHFGTITAKKFGPFWPGPVFEECNMAQAQPGPIFWEKKLAQPGKKLAQSTAMVDSRCSKHGHTNPIDVFSNIVKYLQKIY